MTDLRRIPSPALATGRIAAGGLLPLPARRRVAGLVLAAMAGVSLGQLQPVADGPVGVRLVLPEALAQSSINATLAVLVIPAQRKNADDAEALERLLGESVGRLDTVRTFDLSPVADTENAGKVADSIEDALRALLLRTPKRAGERVLAAEAMLATAPAAADDRQYARLFKAKGLIALSAGDLVQARDWLVKSLILMPNQQLAEYASYGSTAKELFESAKGAVDKLPVADLRVTTRGAKADIYVDGAWKGAGQVTASDLRVGRHLVTVRSPGMVGERQFVDVVAGKPAVVDFDLKPAAFGPDLEAGRNVLIANYKQPSVVEDRARELRNQLGADTMIIVRPNFSKKATELDGWFLGADGSFKKLTATIDKDERYLDKLGEFLATASGAKLGPATDRVALDLRQSVVVSGGSKARTGGEAYIDPNAPLFEDGTAKEEPLTRKWWFWTAVAGGAALIGGGLYLLASGQAQEAQGATGTLSFKLNQAQGN
jgi:hypothetical protein